MWKSLFSRKDDEESLPLTRNVFFAHYPKQRSPTYVHTNVSRKEVTDPYTGRADGSTNSVGMDPNVYGLGNSHRPASAKKDVYTRSTIMPKSTKGVLGPYTSTMPDGKAVTSPLAHPNTRPTYPTKVDAKSWYTLHKIHDPVSTQSKESPYMHATRY